MAVAPTPLSQSPSYLLISVPNQFPNLHLKIRPRIPDNRVFIRIFETCALPLNALSTILSLCYDSLLFFFFLIIFHFSIYHEYAIRTCFSIHGFITEKQRYEVRIQMNWSGDSGRDGWWGSSKTEFQHAPMADVCVLYIILDAVQSWMREGAL